MYDTPLPHPPECHWVSQCLDKILRSAMGVWMTRQVTPSAMVPVVQKQPPQLQQYQHHTHLQLQLVACDALCSSYCHPED